MQSNLHSRLREATRADHERLEQQGDILGRIASPAGRRGLLEQFYVLHASVERAIAPWLADWPGLEFEARRRTTILQDDLDALGLPAPQRRIAVEAGSVGAALGLMYVLEGSTLGGRVIEREVKARGDDLLGLSFLHPYGDRSGERWRNFMALVDEAAQTPAEVEAVLFGASAGFRHAETCLSGAVETPIRPAE